MHQHCSKYLPIDPLPGPCGGGHKVKIQLFQNVVMLRINLKGMTNAATCKPYSVLTHTLDPWGGIKGQNIFFLKVVKLHIKLIGMEH